MEWDPRTEESYYEFNCSMVTFHYYVPGFDSYIMVQH